jgi:hypothetical protein
MAEAGNSGSDSISGSEDGVRSLESQLVAVDTMQGSQTRAGSSRPAAEPLIPFRDWDINHSEKINSADQDGAEQKLQRAAVTSGIGSVLEGLHDKIEAPASDSIQGALDCIVTSATPVMRTGLSSEVESIETLRSLLDEARREIQAVKQGADRARDERAEAEKERADRERDKKEAEWKRAEAEKERADRERDKKEAEWKRAEAEKERADKESEDAEKARKRSKVKVLLTTTQLVPVLQKQESSEKYKETVEASSLAQNSIFCRFLPSSDWLKKSHGVPLNKDTLHRFPPKFTHGLWNEDMGEGGAHRAHLVPLSWDCCMEWLCLFVPFVIAGAPDVSDVDLLCLCMLLGLKLQAEGGRYTFSGFMHSAFNFIPLRGQERLLDINPTIMFVPMLSVLEVLFWNGEPYRCLIIGKEKDGMSNAGFCFVTARTPPPTAGTTPLVNAESFCELETDDRSVMDAFKTFNTLLTLVVPFLASKPLKQVATVKAGLCGLFRAFLTNVTPSESGTVPDVMCPTVPAGRVVVCLKFHWRDPQFPAFGGAPARANHRKKKLTALPHPFLLFLKALNAWFNCLHLCRTWPDWNTYFDKERSTTIEGTRRRISHACPLILLPSCRDMDMASCACMLCKSADVVEDVEVYPLVSDKEWRAVTSMLDPTAPPITEEEAGLISKVRRHLVPGGACQWEEDVGDEAEAGGTGTGGD